jgi:hypothetical protein
LNAVSASDIIALSFGLMGTIVGIITILVTRNQHISSGSSHPFAYLRTYYLTLYTLSSGVSFLTGLEPDPELSILNPTSTPTLQNENLDESLSITPHEPAADTHQMHQAIGDAFEAISRFIRVRS